MEINPLEVARRAKTEAHENLKRVAKEVNDRALKAGVAVFDEENALIQQLKRELSDRLQALSQNRYRAEEASRKADEPKIKEANAILREAKKEFYYLEKDLKE